MVVYWIGKCGDARHLVTLLACWCGQVSFVGAGELLWLISISGIGNTWAHQCTIKVLRTQLCSGSPP